MTGVKWELQQRPEGELKNSESTKLRPRSYPAMANFRLRRININGQMGHGENILLCLLSSSNEEERELAVGKIREIRAKDLDIGELRQFHPRDYTLNLSAATLLDLPEEGFKTEPPVTIGLTDNQLELILTQPLNVLLPLTTVAVERAVAETTKASRQVTEDKDLSYLKLTKKYLKSGMNVLLFTSLSPPFQQKIFWYFSRYSILRFCL